MSEQYEEYHRILEDLAAGGVETREVVGDEAGPASGGTVREAFIRAFRDELAYNDRRERQ